MWWRELTGKEILVVINALLSSDEVVGYRKGHQGQDAKIMFSKNREFDGSNNEWLLEAKMKYPIEGTFLNPTGMWDDMRRFDTLSPRGKEKLLNEIFSDLLDLPGRNFSEKQILRHRLTQMAEVIQRLLG